MRIKKNNYDVIIVGMGVAGLNCALNIDENKSVLLISKDRVDKADSYLAQGGICRLVNDDDYDEYFEDTMRAGHYENNPKTVECMIKNSIEVIDDLISYGVDFKRKQDGSLLFTREGGHHTPRICYHEDTTGKEIASKLFDAVLKRSNIEVCSHMIMQDIIEKDNTCYGLIIRDKKEKYSFSVACDYVVLASGGLGGLYENSTNYRVLTGDAVAICLKHNVAVDNIDYIQVHPTTLYTTKGGKRFLISESVRGEGALLLDKNYNRFCNELEPRDVVTKNILKQMQKDDTKHVWLDLRVIDREEIESHFPNIVATCKSEGYDVFNECIPVVPAQHYFMGGIRSDLEGKTTMNRLYAVGETCCNGVHGKNRLASNSLLESLLFAKRAGRDISNNFSKVNDDVASSLVTSDLLKYYYDNHKEIQKQYKKSILKAIKESKK